MIEILGKASPAKRQFLYTLGTLLVCKYGKYAIYSESFGRQEEDYIDGLTVYPLKDYCGQESCVVEAEMVSLQAEHTIYYLTPCQPELELFSRYLERIRPKEIMLIFGDHIKESVLNKTYVKRMIAEASEETGAEIWSIELDKLNKLIENEGLVEGYYPLSSLSREYKIALAEAMRLTTGTPCKECKKYFRMERRRLK